MSIVESNKLQPSIYDSLIGNNFSYQRFQSFVNQQKISEIEKLKQQIEGIAIPFENPQVGDKVKPI